MRRSTALLSLLVLIAPATALADVVHLKDGSRLDGDVKKGTAGYVVTLPGGKVELVPLDKVKSIELGAAPGSADAAKEKLASLRRSVEYLDDPKKITERYQRFIEQNANTPVEVEARKDLAMWQERQARELVKFAGKWVTVEERAALQEKAFRQADAARKLLRAGKLAEADSTITQALAEDPQNAAAMYLRGLLQFRQELVVQARKSFETVNTIFPNHAPTLNNLGVVAVRQNQFVTAVNYYDQAMQASPKTREVLNNVAELLYNMPDEQRDTPVAQKVLRRFNEQDAALAGELEKQGLHRWGSTWVTTEQLDSLKDAERQAKDKLDALSAEFDAVKVRISNIDRDIAENDRSMRRMQNTSYVRDINGTIYQAPLPGTYYRMQDDNRKLSRERDEQFARLNKLREDAKAVNRDLPVPKYSGIQKMMDENFAPVQVPTAPGSPATQASTKPAT
jgi:tetratricopeptide (TPR) repeat protein